MSDVIESSTQLRILAEEKDLVGKTLRDLVAPRVGLSDADLDGVTMERVGLVDGNLAGARLENASLKSVDLTRARFVGAIWYRVRATECDFTQLSLEGAEIRHCELGPNVRGQRISFERAKIQGSSFNRMDLYGASFKHAVILRTRFEGYGGMGTTSSLTRASFSESVLVEVDLREANMINADLSRALLIRCDLRQASLNGANLAGARLIDCRTEFADFTDTEVG